MGVHVYVFIFCDKQLKSVKDTNSQELSFSKTLLPMCIELHVYHVFWCLGQNVEFPRLLNFKVHGGVPSACIAEYRQTLQYLAGLLFSISMDSPIKNLCIAFPQWSPHTITSSIASLQEPESFLFHGLKPTLHKHWLSIYEKSVGADFDSSKQRLFFSICK